jgi:hypothetical protein
LGTEVIGVSDGAGGEDDGGGEGADDGGDDGAEDEAAGA